MPSTGLEIKLTPPQEQFFLAKERYVGFVGGFGSGKSQALFVKLLYDKFAFPDVNLLYAAPTYSLIRDIAHDRLCAMLDQAPVKYRLNKADNVLEIRNYGKILFRTLDSPDRLVGFEVFRAYIDELDTLKLDSARAAWNKLIARCRQKTSKNTRTTNQIFVATTPEGFRFVYHRWVKDANIHYRLIRAPTASNPHLPPGYIESLRASYPEELVEAYLNGQFVNLTSKIVYSSFRRDLNDSDEDYNAQDMLHIGMDFNVNNMNAVVHVIRRGANSADETVHAVAEIVRAKDTPTMIKTLKELFPDHFPNKMYIYPDAYGDSRKSSASEASKTDHGLLREASLTLITPNANPPIKDRIMAMNRMFSDGDGRRLYFVNSLKCPDYVHALESQTYDANGIPVKDSSNNVDDINDASGYFISRKYPLIKNKFTMGTTRNY
jgi:PBSX family phage terminase large subunit